MSKTTAQLPVGGYSSTAFFGAAAVAPQNNQPSAVNALDNKTVLIVAAAFIAVGYLAFHLNER